MRNVNFGLASVVFNDTEYMCTMEYRGVGYQKVFSSIYFLLEMVEYGLKCPFTVCEKSERSSRSQEHPLSFLQCHGGDKLLSDKLRI